ncbi:MAG: hypothetical protein HOP34_06665 [Methylococcaceae bacterium]|nr:hypothetical protein [Methylococcaceae bacterium]
MNGTTIKKQLAWLAWLAIGTAHSAWAHDQSGALGAAAGATDLYLVTCYDDNEGNGASEHLSLDITDNAPKAAAMISMQVFKGGKALNTTDAREDSLASPELQFAGGDGAYWVVVNKSAAGKENYAIVYHCQNSTGGHTGTTITPLQNQ